MAVYAGMDRVELRKHLKERLASLDRERCTLFPFWEDITKNILPMAGRYFRTSRNQGGRHKYNDIYDNSGTRALRVIGAGMMAGASSPARPWFRMSTSDPDLDQFHPVKQWLDDVTKQMMVTFSNSNVYRTLHLMYEELAAFGTAASIIAADFESVIWMYPSPVGEFHLATDFKGQVNTLYRTMQRTVSEVVDEFGYDVCCYSTRKAYDRRQYENPVDIIHAIQPRQHFDSRYIDNRNMEWASVYFELGADDKAGVLRESGFDRFPVIAPRWGVNGGDIYGYGPGMEALGDIRQLQQEQLRKGQAIDYQTMPPLQVPTSMKDRDREFFPGGVSFYDQSTPHGGIRNAFEVNLDLGGLLHDIEDVRRRINSAFYADLFLLLAASSPDHPQRTAKEVAVLEEEKLLQLGPAMVRMRNEMHAPLIEQTFLRMLEVGMLPPPPPDVQGKPVEPEFISILDQAQRMIGLTSIDRWVTGVMTVAQAKPEVLDKFNADQWVNISADRLGVDPDMVVADERVEELREARNQAMAAQQQAEALNVQSQTAKNLAQADTTGDNALTAALGELSGL